MDLVVLINVARGSSTSLMEAKSCGWLILHNFHHNEALSKKHARKRASARTHACREGMMGEKERRDLFSNKCRKITMIHHKCGFQPEPKILANRLIAIFTIPADSLRSTVSLQLIHQMDLSSQWVHQSQLDVGFKASKHFNCMLKASVLAVYKKSYQDQLEFVTFNGFHLSNTIRPPRPILPWNLYGGIDVSFFIDESACGTMPAAANLSGTRGFVNKSTGSRGSCVYP